MTLVMICSGRMDHKIVVQILKMERTLCTHRKKIYNTVYNTIFALNLFEIFIEKAWNRKCASCTCIRSMGPLKNTLWINPWMFFYCITLGWKIQHYFCINDLFIGEDLPLWVWWRSNCCILNTGNSCAAMTGEAGPLSRTIGTTNRTDMETGKFLNSSRKSGTFSHIFITKY